MDLSSHKLGDFYILGASVIGASIVQKCSVTVKRGSAIPSRSSSRAVIARSWPINKRDSCESKGHFTTTDHHQPSIGKLPHAASQNSSSSSSSCPLQRSAVTLMCCSFWLASSELICRSVLWHMICKLWWPFPLLSMCRDLQVHSSIVCFMQIVHLLDIYLSRWNQTEDSQIFIIGTSNYMIILPPLAPAHTRTVA